MKYIGETVADLTDEQLANTPAFQIAEEAETGMRSALRTVLVARGVKSTVIEKVLGSLIDGCFDHAALVLSVEEVLRGVVE